MFFAAATSAIALLEAVAAYLIDNFHWKRSTATVSMALLMGVIGIFASLSMGVLSDASIFGMNLFDAMGYLSDKILMPLAAFFMCIFVGHIWGVDSISKEIEEGAGAFKTKRVFGAILRYVAPVVIFIIFIVGLFPPA